MGGGRERGGRGIGGRWRDDRGGVGESREKTERKEEQTKMR